MRLASGWWGGVPSLVAEASKRFPLPCAATCSSRDNPLLAIGAVAKTGRSYKELPSDACDDERSAEQGGPTL